MFWTLKLKLSNKELASTLCIWYRNASYYYYLRQGGYVFVVVFPSVCLSVCLLATLHNNFRLDLHEIITDVWQWPMNKWLNFGGDPDHRLDTWIVFRIRHYWQIGKVVSTDCTARRCSGLRAPTGIAIATITSLRHRPLAEVCTVPVLLHTNYNCRLRRLQNMSPVFRDMIVASIAT